MTAILTPRPDLKDFPPAGNYLRMTDGLIYEVAPGATIEAAKAELKRIENREG